MEVFVDAETAPLRSVIVGYPDNFLQVDAEIINETQRQYYDGPDAPTAEAGPNLSVAEGSIAVLDGTASSDPEGQTLSYT